MLIGEGREVRSSRRWRTSEDPSFKEREGGRGGGLSPGFDMGLQLGLPSPFRNSDVTSTSTWALLSMFCLCYSYESLAHDVVSVREG